MEETETIKSFSQFLVEQKRTDVQELYAVGFISLKDYIQHVIDSESDLEDWVEKNVVIIRVDFNKSNSAELTVVYNNFVYLVIAPMEKETRTVNVLKTELAEIIEDPSVKFIIRMLPLNLGKTWGFQLSNLSKLDYTESINIRRTPLLDACYEIINKHRLTS